MSIGGDRSMKRPYILHPFLFAAFPVLSLYASNITEVRPEVLMRPLAVSLAVVGLLILLFRPFSRKWRRAALAASLVMVLFASYGHVYGAAFRADPNLLFAKADVLLALWMAVMIVGVWALVRLLKKTRELTRVLNIVSASLVLMLVVFALWNLAPRNMAVTWKTPANLNPQPGPNWDGTKPDIYYIILDEYGSESALRDIYGLDNSLFLDGLRQRGFTIKDHSAANYWRTGPSLSSSLNFHYISELGDFPAESTDLRPVEQMISDSAARRFLERQGYRTVAFSTNFFYTDVRDADVYYNSRLGVTPFELKLLAGSMAVFFVDWAAPVFRRAEIRQHFADLADSTTVEGPKFIFAHLVVPHPPFVFDAEGQPVTMQGEATENYLKGYAGQLQYTNRLVEEAVDAILANSATPPVIIIQGDHGPGAYFTWYSTKETCLRERFPILNAYYLPGKADAAAAIPADISPVNAFRVIFNAYFDTQLPLEPNHHYAVFGDYIYQHEEVTDRLDWCPAVPARTGQ